MHPIQLFPPDLSRNSRAHFRTRHALKSQVHPSGDSQDQLPFLHGEGGRGRRKKLLAEKYAESHHELALAAIAEIQRNAEQKIAYCATLD